MKNDGGRRDSAMNLSAMRIGTLFLMWCVSLLGVAATGPEQMNNEERIYPTGLTGKASKFAVAPDGRQLVFNAGRLEHGLRLLDLSTGKIETVPTAAGRYWEMPRWSTDGKQVVAVSTAVRDNHYVIDDMQVILLDPVTWTHRTVSTGEGVKIFPFFAADGKTVYYFKGKKRDGGATFASRFDLYAIDLASGREERLTDEEMYQVSRGEEQGGSVMFSAYGLKRYPSEYFNKALKRMQPQSGLYAYDVASRTIRLIQVDQSSGGFDFYGPRRDKAGNVYFVAAKEREGGGNFRWFVFRASAEGSAPIILAEVPISMGFDIARNTGEIYVMAKQGEEIVFRRLRVRANH